MLPHELLPNALLNMLEEQSLDAAVDTTEGGSDDSSDRTTVLSVDQETLKKEMAKASEQPACLIIIRGTPQGHRYLLAKTK